MTKTENNKIQVSATSAVLRVGDGRGFVVECRNHLGLYELIVVTAAHCLPFFPMCHPASYLEDRTYRRLLGALGAEPTVWAECLFADPIADIAVLGMPDNQDLWEQAEAYGQLLESTQPLVVADAPAQDRELLSSGDPGEGSAYVLSLDGHWLEGRVMRRGGRLSFKPEEFFVGGMSGSPIVDATGAAIGVVSVDLMSPVIVDGLSAQLLRSIRAAHKRVRTRCKPGMSKRKQENSDGTSAI